MIKYILALLVAWLPFGGQAQNSHPAFSSQKIIPSRELMISWNKTCLLVFPAEIKSADRGSADVLAERVKGAENALKVKAGRPDFEPSSLTVVTTDGQVFAFRVSYAENPPYLVLDFRGASSEGATVKFKGVPLNSAQFKRGAERVKGNAPFLKRVHSHKQALDVELNGIYIHEGVLFFRFRLHNDSSIPYKRGALRFFIRDVKTARRTAVRDNELKPLYLQTWGLPEEEMGQTIVVALHRFTLAEDKSLTIALMEEDDGRSVTLKLKERKLRKTRKLYHQ